MGKKGSSSWFSAVKKAFSPSTDSDKEAKLHNTDPQSKEKKSRWTVRRTLVMKESEEGKDTKVLQEETPDQAKKNKGENFLPSSVIKKKHNNMIYNSEEEEEAAKKTRRAVILMKEKGKREARWKQNRDEDR